MALEFKSAHPEGFVLEEYDGHGRKRVGTAKPAGRNWEIKVVHPDGRHWQARLSNGSRLEASFHLAQLMDDKRHEFIQGRQRNDTPHYRTNTIAPVAESDTVFKGYR